MRPAQWTEPEWKRLKKYIRKLQRLLCLGQWELVLAHRTTGDDGDSDAWASINPREAKHEAELTLCWDFRDLSPEKQRYALTHELLHLYHRDQTEVIRLGLPKVLGEVSYSLVWEPFRQHTELMVDDLARMLAPSMPLPKLASKAQRERDD